MICSFRVGGRPTRTARCGGGSPPEPGINTSSNLDGIINQDFVMIPVTVRGDGVYNATGGVAGTPDRSKVTP
jgi:hypothetical protein